MKKMILSLLALVFAAPVMATEPSDLSGLGLSGLSVVSEEAGMEIRGLGGVAASSGLSTMRLFVIDPMTGSTFNANASNFSRGAEDTIAPATITDPQLASAGTFAGFGSLALDIGDFSFTFSGAAASGGNGSTGAAPDVGFSFNATSFSFSTAPVVP